jgi:hypothetical protein
VNMLMVDIFWSQSTQDNVLVKIRGFVPDWVNLSGNAKTTVQLTIHNGYAI